MRANSGNAVSKKAHIVAMRLVVHTSLTQKATEVAVVGFLEIHQDMNRQQIEEKCSWSERLQKFQLHILHQRHTIRKWHTIRKPHIIQQRHIVRAGHLVSVINAEQRTTNLEYVLGVWNVHVRLKEGNLFVREANVWLNRDIGQHQR